MDRYQPDPRDQDAEPGAANAQREASRDSLLLAATLRVGGKETHVRVRNLSAGGLMAEYPGSVELGQAVSIDVRGIGWVDGRVAWATDGRVGIAFSAPVDPKLARKPVNSNKPRGEQGWLHVYPAAVPPRMKR
ncbi:PilZ domain-containing protein [Sphingomonas sp.]|uniref:PilZ domain-containing protein n=1 Tax=Sphingomonas sp. TaxID=28214 RepID=UPI002C97D914|nr:PilZ domain-containing protein [Sphingomonas sp.]HTG37709.1 PilZ domain-containing protein [Sphingomonas sp.]